MPPVEVGRYFWLSFVRNSSADTASFYVDGEAVSTAAADAGEMEGTANAVIGRNLDGRIDITDAVLLNRAVSGSVSLNAQATKNADCDANGDLSGNDAVVLMRFLVHLENQLPVESA